MTQLICKKIDGTNYFYFGPCPEHLLFVIHCDEIEQLVGEAAYSAIRKVTEDGEEAKVTIAMSVQLGG